MSADGTTVADRVTGPPGWSPAAAPRRAPSSSRATLVVAVVLALLAVVLAVTTVSLSGDLDAVRDDVAALREEVAAGEATAEDLRGQLADLSAAADAAFDPAAVTEEVSPSVFMIVVPIDEQYASLGTGFVFAQDGRASLVVTNYHVVQERWAAGLEDVLLTRGTREYTGEIVRVSAADDLAVVRVDAELPVLEMAPEVTVGEPIVVIGSGDGLEGTVTTGVVSAVDRLLEGARWLQVSAQVNQGNSGGPVVDAEGRVLGVVTVKLVAVEIEGLSFAIPIARVCDVLDLCGTGAAGGAGDGSAAGS